jgi:ligand-binding SRPBCC domain-containing protein
MSVRFHHGTLVDATIERVFDLSLDIDSHLASMAASKERAVAGVLTGHIGFGQSVTWRATHFGVPFTMTSKITELDRPNRFVDQQTKGPFHSFRHEHLFTTVEGRTLMTDRVEFVAPVGPVGRALELLVLERYLRRLIRIRGLHIKAEAESTGQ